MFLVSKCCMLVYTLIIKFAKLSPHSLLYTLSLFQVYFPHSLTLHPPLLPSLTNPSLSHVSFTTILPSRLLSDGPRTMSPSLPRTGSRSRTVPAQGMPSTTSTTFYTQIAECIGVLLWTVNQCRCFLVLLALSLLKVTERT